MGNELHKKINQTLTAINGVENVTWKQNNDINSYTIHTEKGKDLREDISQTVVASGGIIRELKTEVMKLEDIFIHITTKETS